MYVVKATPASGSSGENEPYIIGTARTLEGAKWLGLADFVENWVQGEWDEYNALDVYKFRRALLDKRVDTAWDVQKGMSGYRLEIEEVETAQDPAPFDIEEDFDEDINVYEVWARVEDLGLLDVVTDLDEHHFGASTRDGKRHVDVWWGKHGFTYELRDSGGSDVLQAGGGGAAEDVVILVIRYLRTGEYK